MGPGVTRENSLQNCSKNTGDHQATKKRKTEGKRKEHVKLYFKVEISVNLLVVWERESAERKNAERVKTQKHC